MITTSSPLAFIVLVLNEMVLVLVLDAVSSSTSTVLLSTASLSTSTTKSDARHEQGIVWLLRSDSLEASSAEFVGPGKRVLFRLAVRLRLTVKRSIRMARMPFAGQYACGK
jgi:hypothetical protein